MRRPPQEPRAPVCREVLSRSSPSNFAPRLIHSAIFRHSISESGSPPLGMRASFGASSRAISRLFSASPMTSKRARLAPLLEARERVEPQTSLGLARMAAQTVLLEDRCDLADETDPLLRFARRDRPSWLPAVTFPSPWQSLPGGR